MQSKSDLVADLVKFEVLTVSDFCTLYHIRRRTYEGWLKSDNPPPFFERGEKRLFVRSEVLAWRTPKPKAKRG